MSVERKDPSMPLPAVIVTANLHDGYKFWHQTAAAGYVRDVEVAISAFNALNDKHQEHPLGDTIGSRTMGWLTIRF